jgi:prepilin-type N-terminal cleavage/methylation domain-containing protein
MKNKGFTVIELIVVITIIAVLSTIVLVKVTQYMSKGKDAAIKKQVKLLSTNAVSYFASNGSYTDMCLSGTKCSQIKNNILKLGGTYNSPYINLTGSAYCMDFTLSDGVTTLCIDSTGYLGEEDNCSSGLLDECITCRACGE